MSDFYGSLVDDPRYVPKSGEDVGMSQPQAPSFYQSLVGGLERARNFMGGDPTIGGGVSMAMSAIPGAGPAGARLYSSLLKEAGTNPTMFKTVFGSLQADKMSKAELVKVAEEFTGLPAVWKTKDAVLDAIQKTWVRRARFENKLAP